MAGRTLDFTAIGYQLELDPANALIARIIGPEREVFGKWGNLLHSNSVISADGKYIAAVILGGMAIFPSTMKLNVAVSFDASPPSPPMQVAAE